MRFGIMTMQLGMLVPPSLDTLQVMANLQSFDQYTLVKELFDMGFNPIELSGDLGMFLPQSFSAESIRRLVALKERGLRYTAHLPIWSVEPSTPLSPVSRGSAEAIAHIIKAVMPLEPEACILHATGSLAAEFYNMKISETARSIILRQFQAAARQSLIEILEQTHIPSRCLAIETIEYPLDMTLQLADELDLSLCLDTGHVLAGFPGWFDLLDVLEQCLPRLAEVHLHDSRKMPPGRRGYGEDHKTLGTGDLDLAHLLDRLNEAGYEGPVILEMTVAEALQSLQAVRSLRPQYIS